MTPVTVTAQHGARRLATAIERLDEWWNRLDWGRPEQTASWPADRATCCGLVARMHRPWTRIDYSEVACPTSELILSARSERLDASRVHQFLATRLSQWRCPQTLDDIPFNALLRRQGQRHTSLHLLPRAEHPFFCRIVVTDKPRLDDLVVPTPWIGIGWL